MVRLLAVRVAHLRGHQNAVNAANELVSHAEAIKKCHIRPRDLSEEEGEMTPTMKVKRNIVVDKFAREVEDMYHR